MKKALWAALNYRNNFNFSVIPVGIFPGKDPNKLEKKPLLSWAEFQDRIATEEEIRSWWDKWPDAQVGIVTGKLSDIFVVDLDTDEAKETFEKTLPETLIPPTALTPRGGKHYYFRHVEGFPNRANYTPGLDIRTQGGFIVAPPSQANGNGKAWSWSTALQNAPLAVPPASSLELLKAALNTNLNSYSFSNSLYGGVSKKEGESYKNLQMFKHGRQDEDLFHVANCLTRGGMPQNEQVQVLERIVFSWGGEKEAGWVESKVKSALQRAEKRERNLTKEFREWIYLQNAYWKLTDAFSGLQILTKEEKNATHVAINRMINGKDAEGIVLEKHPSMISCYRLLVKDCEEITFEDDEDEGEFFDVRLPMGLNNLVRVYQGNIVLVAGEWNSGKTSFLLNVLVSNKNRFPIRYISSEMRSQEFKLRFKTFGIDKDHWMPDAMTKYIKASSSVYTQIDPDGLNIIDYLEFPNSDYTKGSELLVGIHNALRKGIAVVGVQKKEGQRLPRSSDMVLEKPRLAIALSKDVHAGPDNIGVVEILKAKIPIAGKCDGKKLRFEFIGRGSGFKVLQDWGYWK